MKTLPLVSICIPTYNRPGFLAKAIKSCLNQTYKNYEIVITDNSQDSRSELVVREFSNPKIRYYKNRTNIGSYRNLQKASSYAKGKYIKFLLDDDILDRNCLEEMVKVFEKHNNVGLIMSPLRIIDENGEKFTPTFYFIKKMRHLYKYLDHDSLVDKDLIMSDFLTRTYPCCVPTGIMVRNSIFKKIGGFKKKYEFVTDLELCMNFAKHSDFYYIDKYLSSWRYSQSSETVSILHKKGIKLNIFYELMKDYMFDKIQEKDAYLFASKRTFINCLAGLKSGNVSLIFRTISTIFKEEKYFINIMKLPLEITKEVIQSIKS